jgi:hypothetical protein
VALVVHAFAPGVREAWAVLRGEIIVSPGFRKKREKAGPPAKSNVDSYWMQDYDPLWTNVKNRCRQTRLVLSGPSDRNSSYRHI